jgi:hypothetical protein
VWLFYFPERNFERSTSSRRPRKRLNDESCSRLNSAVVVSALTRNGERDSVSFKKVGCRGIYVDRRLFCGRYESSLPVVYSQLNRREVRVIVRMNHERYCISSRKGTASWQRVVRVSQGSAQSPTWKARPRQRQQRGLFKQLLASSATRSGSRRGVDLLPVDPATGTQPHRRRPLRTPQLNLRTPRRFALLAPSSYDSLFTNALLIIPIARLNISLSAGEGVIEPGVHWVSSP